MRMEHSRLPQDVQRRRSVSFSTVFPAGTFDVSRSPWWRHASQNKRMVKAGGGKSVTRLPSVICSATAKEGPGSALSSPQPRSPGSRLLLGEGVTLLVLSPGCSWAYRPK
jgi:hypothetical protein